jgi:hypothetical protein
MTDDERSELLAIRKDLLDEESDQHEQRGHASSRILRAVARLERILDGTPNPSDDPVAGPSAQP